MWPKGRIIQLITVLYVMFGVNSLQAAWWEIKNLPIPSHTTQTKEITRKAKGSEMDMIYYSSALPSQDIRDFYRTKLAQSGWEERNALAELGKISGAPATADLRKVRGSELIFKKDTQTIVLKITAEGTKTDYILGKVKMPHRTIPRPDVFSLPKVTTLPKQDIAPVYPDAYLIQLSEKKNSQSTSYFSKDGIEPIFSFYKTNMPRYGWALKEEVPAETIDLSRQIQKEPPKDKCPACAEKIPGPLIQKGSSWAELAFSNAQGESCKILLLKPLLEGEKKGSLNQTLISVVYEKKK